MTRTISLTSMPSRARRRIARTMGALGVVMLLGGCVVGDWATEPGRDDRRVVGAWYRMDYVNDAWYGSARLETTWRFRSNGRFDYTEVLTDHGGWLLEEIQADGDWHAERYGDRLTLQYYYPASWGRDVMYYDVRGGRLYLDGVRYDRW